MPDAYTVGALFNFNSNARHLRTSIGSYATALPLNLPAPSALKKRKSLLVATNCLHGVRSANGEALRRRQLI